MLNSWAKIAAGNIDEAEKAKHAALGSKLNELAT